MRGAAGFFLLTYAATWGCFGAAAVATRVPAVHALYWPLLIVGAFAPSAVALVLTYRDAGRAGVHTLLGRLLQWNVGVRWYVFAAGYTLAVKLTVALIYRLAFSAWPRFGSEAWYTILAAMVVATIFGGPLGEELGWRGYALPRLADRFGMARASVLLGVAWACWHAPLFFLPGIDKSGQSLAVYVLQVTALSVAMAWLYRNTAGSLLLAVLMHSAFNQTKDVVPSIDPGASNPLTLHATPVAWLTVAVLWIAAAWMLARMSAPAAARTPASARGS